jgi:tetratricopeptide (TPR) repeat protein
MKSLSLILLLVGCAAPAPKPLLKGEAESTKKLMVVGYTAEDLSARSCPQVIPKFLSIDDDLQTAATCAKNNQWNQVFALGNRMSVKDDSQAWGAYYLSLEAEHAKDLARARWMAELAVKKAPDEGLLLYQLGRIQWLMNEKSVAFKTLESAVIKNPWLSEVHALLGQLALLNDENAEARKHFQSVLDRNSKHFLALMGLAMIAIRAKTFAEAEKHLRAAITSHPQSLEARMQLAWAQENLAKSSGDAIATYREVAKLSEAHKLDGKPAFNIISKIQALQSNLAEEMKQKVSERTPTAERKVK